MKMSADDVGRVYVLDGDVTGATLTDAVNAVQRAFDDYMGDAWEEAKTDEERAAVAVRGMSWTVALAAHHVVLTRGAPESVEEMVSEMVAQTVRAMLAQIEATKRGAKA